MLDEALKFSELSQYARKIHKLWMDVRIWDQKVKYELYRQAYLAVRKVLESEAMGLSIGDVIEHWEEPALIVAEKRSVLDGSRDPSVITIEVVATADGKPAHRDKWINPSPDHRCTGAQEIYYEVLSGPSAGSHGWICDGCRRIAQTG